MESNEPEARLLCPYPWASLVASTPSEYATVGQTFSNKGRFESVDHCQITLLAQTRRIAKGTHQNQCSLSEAVEIGRER